MRFSYSLFDKFCKLASLSVTSINRIQAGAPSCVASFAWLLFKVWQAGGLLSCFCMESLDLQIASINPSDTMNQP